MSKFLPFSHCVFIPQEIVFANSFLLILDYAVPISNPPTVAMLKKEHFENGGTYDLTYNNKVFSISYENPFQNYRVRGAFKMIGDDVNLNTLTEVVLQFFLGTDLSKTNISGVRYNEDHRGVINKQPKVDQRVPETILEQYAR